MNQALGITLEIAKYVLPAVIVLIGVNLVVKKFMIGETKRRQLDIYRNGLEITLRLRLQAYERLAMFLERIQPRTLIPRVYIAGMTVNDLQRALIQSIQAEFDHNLSQQIYITPKLWNTIRGVKEQEQGMINQIAATLNPEHSAKELHKKILDFVMTTEALPVEVALDILHEEAKIVLSQQG